MSGCKRAFGPKNRVKIYPEKPRYRNAEPWENRELLRRAGCTNASEAFEDVMKTLDESREKYGLEVKPSRARSIGNGIFPMGGESIPVGTLVCAYPGHPYVDPSDEPKRPLGRLNLSHYQIDVMKLSYKDPEMGDMGMQVGVKGKRSQDARDANNINHSCVPNCVFETIEVKGGLDFKAVRTVKTIRTGDELTVDYGMGFWRPIEELQKSKHVGFKIVPCICGKCPQKIGVLVPIPKKRRLG